MRNTTFPFLNELTKTEMIALRLFVTLGEASKYDLFTKTGVSKLRKKKTSYSAFHRSVNSLHEKRLIEVTKTIPSKKNPQIEVEFYKMSLAGIIRVLLPLFGLNKWRYEAPEEIHNYALEMVGGLLENYPEMFPAEFYELSDRFKMEIAIDYSIMYVTGEIWDTSLFIRAYMEDKSDALTYYIDLLLIKIGELEEWKETMPPFLEHMTKKDIKVMSKLVERLIDHSDGVIKEATENINSQREYLHVIKDFISQH